MSGSRFLIAGAFITCGLISGCAPAETAQPGGAAFSESDVQAIRELEERFGLTDVRHRWSTR